MQLHLSCWPHGWLGIYALLVLVMLAGFFTFMPSVLARLEFHHRDLWIRYGSARYMPFSPLKQLRLYRFILMGEYRALGDTELNKRAIVVQIITWGFIAIWGVSIIESIARRL